MGEIFVIDMPSEIFQYLQRNRINILVFGKFIFIYLYCISKDVSFILSLAE